MASIERYFRNALIGLATLILSSLSVDSTSLVKTQIDESIDDDPDLHMFI
jgi:hypothetical protein